MNGLKPATVGTVNAKPDCAPLGGSATLLQQLKWNLWWRGPIHRVICWYLRRCAGAFHCYPYGPRGRYVVLMSDEQYHRYGKVRMDAAKCGVWSQSPNDKVSNERR